MKTLIAAFPNVKELGKKIARGLNAEYTTIFVEDFPDSEYHIRLNKSPKDRTVVIVNSISKEVDNKLIETILAGGIARDYKAKKVILMATYFPYLRQDKHFEKFDSFSSKHILKMFNNFDKIITIDPHLHRIKKMNLFSNNAESISAKMLIGDYLKKRFKNNFTIIGPDSESEQWTKPLADRLGKKVIVLAKTRFSATNIKQAEIKDKLNENVVIIDDIISTGKTISGALKIAKEHGAKKLYCIGIHGLLIGDSEKLITKYAELITTNTIPNKYSKIDVSSIIIDKLKKVI